MKWSAEEACYNMKNKVVYNNVNCIYCGGQIMSIYIGRKRICSKCIKCKRDIPNYVIEPKAVCIEEKIGRIMHAYESANRNK